MLTLFLYEEEKQTIEIRSKNTENIPPWGSFQCCAWKQKGEGLFMKSDLPSQWKVSSTSIYIYIKKQINQNHMVMPFHRGQRSHW